MLSEQILQVCYDQHHHALPKIFSHDCIKFHRNKNHDRQHQSTVRVFDCPVRNKNTLETFAGKNGYIIVKHISSLK